MCACIKGAGDRGQEAASILTMALARPCVAAELGSGVRVLDSSAAGSGKAADASGSLRGAEERDEGGGDAEMGGEEGGEEGDGREDEGEGEWEGEGDWEKGKVHNSGSVSVIPRLMCSLTAMGHRIFVALGRARGCDMVDTTGVMHAREEEKGEPSTCMQ